MTQLQKLISPKRSEFYINYAASSAISPFHVYELNISLSASFYASLHYFEIILRNRTANHVSKKWKNWYEADSVFSTKILASAQTNQIKDVHQRLNRAQKSITADAVISDLNLGFWTSLYDKKYSQLIWGNSTAKFVFPNLKKVNPGQISTDLDRIRRFRNRIFHYEQILTYDHNKMKHILNDYLEYMINKKCEFKNNIIKKAPDSD